MRSPNFSALGFVELQNGHVSPHAGKDREPSQEDPNKLSAFFELRSGQMVMLQVKVPQVSLIQYSIDDIARASQSGFFVRNRDFV